MEKLPLKNNNENPKDIEFQETIKQYEEEINKIDKLLNECLEDIRGFMSDLNEQKENLQTIEEMIGLYKKMEGLSPNVFKQEDIDKAKTEIGKTQAVIDEINNEMNKFKDIKSSLTIQMEGYNNLKTGFKNLETILKNADVLLKTGFEGQ
jgi:chromosome segregation ATPase